MESWARSSRIYHWVIGILILGMIAGGLALENELFKGMDKSVGRSVMALHKATGMVILALMALRLANRLGKFIPTLPANTPDWQLIIARVSHFALYVLAFTMPISGYLWSSAYGRTVSIYGLFDLPNLVAIFGGLDESGRNAGLGKLAGNTHGFAANILIAFVALHIGAALYHHFVKKDTVLLRMLRG